MPIIRLSPLLIDQIAAGEVIERPAAAVKELVENALDAGARHIDISIEQGGRKRIRIVDDGCGMRADELALAIERHATSKLPYGSLDRIQTLGFRGEALPSIGAVARLAITSRARGAEGAHLIRVVAGHVTPPQPAALQAGTRIEVEDLFHATPARLKFLKGDRAEAQAAALVIRRLAMAHPETRFTLAGDHLSGFDLLAQGAGEAGRATRIADILGADFAANAVPLTLERNGMMLRGLASLPTYHRASSVDQYLFVNNRPVRDKLLIGALRAAYADSMVSGRHPVVALFLTLDPAAVDVNVHPGKLEVRFRESEAVRSLIVAGIRDALAGAGHQSSNRGGAGLVARLQAHSPAFAAASGYASPRYQPAPQRPLSFAFPDGVPDRASLPPSPVETGFAEAAPFTAQEAMADAPPLGYARAQVHETYIIAQTRDGVVIVDQHAAHERLVYERLKRARAEAGIARQPLLIPAVVEMDDGAIARLMTHEAEIAASGLVIEEFGRGAILLREVPSALAHVDGAKLLRNLSDTIADWDGAESLEARGDLVLKTIACHHSIRAGRRMKLEEMDALLREMEATPGSGQCNHGRPTSITLNLSDLERLFGR